VTSTYPLRENGTVSLDKVVGRQATAADREVARLSIARLGVRLRQELGLREDAVAVEDTPTGPVLKARGVAGTMTVGAATFDIRPKHVEDSRDPLWQMVLLTMLERASRRRAAYSRTRQLRFRSGTFVDQMAMGLAMHLEEATRRPEVRAYRSTREELGQLRGRLLVTEQLRSSLLKPHRVVCEVDELSGDNPVNRLLHWAVQQLGAMASQPSVRRALSVQGGRLPAVTHPVKAPTRLVFHLPRQYHHYTGAVELATAFARGLTIAHGARDVGGAGFLIGTERLFESFIERSLANAFARDDEWQVVAQVRSRFAEPVGGPPGRSAYFSKPDNVLRRRGVPALLVDAKYKRFGDSAEQSAPNRPTHGDLYQMAAACMAHDCPRALLVYPAMSDHGLGQDWEPQWWRIRVGDSERRIGAVPVPLHSLAGDDGPVEFDRRLRRMVLAAAVGRAAVPAPLGELERAS
jgi:5-methylcytosine-specific restriction endonuclease McrBC regulatory subunit McrC